MNTTMRYNFMLTKVAIKRRRKSERKGGHEDS